MKSLNIMTGLSGDNEIFVNYEAFKEIIDKLVFQYIRETFKIKKKNTGQPTRLCREAPTSTLFPTLHLGIMEMFNNVQKPKSETSSQQGDQSFLWIFYILIFNK